MVKEMVINCDVCGEKVISIQVDNCVFPLGIDKIPVREFKKIVCSTCCFQIQEDAHKAGLEGKATPKIKGLDISLMGEQHEATVKRLEKKYYQCGSCKNTTLGNLKPGDALVCLECGELIQSTDEVKP